MICFILLIVDFICGAFGVQFAQDTVSLGIASVLEIIAEVLVVSIISIINMSSGSAK